MILPHSPWTVKDFPTVPACTRQGPSIWQRVSFCYEVFFQLLWFRICSFSQHLSALVQWLPLQQRLRLSSGSRTTEKQRNSNNCSLKREYSGMCQWTKAPGHIKLNQNERVVLQCLKFLRDFPCVKPTWKPRRVRKLRSFFKPIPSDPCFLEETLFDITRNLFWIAF